MLLSAHVPSKLACTTHENIQGLKTLIQPCTIFVSNFLPRIFHFYFKSNVVVHYPTKAWRHILWTAVSGSHIGSILWRIVCFVNFNIWWDFLFHMILFHSISRSAIALHKFDHYIFFQRWNIWVSFMKFEISLMKSFYCHLCHWCNFLKYHLLQSFCLHRDHLLFQ